ncbi:MAG: N-6 DNA Methylase [Syntrophorhabdus sp. PtaU1.Bin153]|nr:MAG: N-6 DNA Methylase [Syntrophorhabdus sp. PtaU1.Bin153]
MPTDHRTELKEIRTFPSLVRYLRDEMGWPIESDDFEELTFEYTPEELGIDVASAAKIQDIKRLRPLTPNQPWGIFFVKFEPRRLPVVALRRILSSVALKKRSSANSDDRAAWVADDLLFISNYGEGDKRQISFAHFSQNKLKGDLPTLKVLGWDNLDTPLHLDHAAELLTSLLAWPDDESDVVRWRESWGSAFILRPREVITTSKVLAVRLAELARTIRDRIHTVLAIETEKGPITRLMKAFQEALVHDLDAHGFSDMYAQTIAYGLLSARITNPKANAADDLATQLPVTNPFLKELMETFFHVGGRRGKAKNGSGIDFDELGVSEVVELLDDANMEAVVRDFGDKNPQEDPVIHFYELFLKEYDAEQKAKRGVFYTPRPVVSYIVRSVDEVLRTEFGLEDGLADTTTWDEMTKRHKDLTIPEGVDPDQCFVQILDPAVGTGTFLVEVIDLIHGWMADKWKAENHSEKKIESLWNEYVPKHLLPRLYGYELLMAPYTIAHLKIGLKLYETGYHFDSDERIRIYLTNALEAAANKQLTLDFMPALAHEAQAVNEIKRQQRFTVVIGNPPYSVVSLNSGAWISSLMDLYKMAVRHERNIQPLSDDYIKFLRLGHFVIECAGCGVLSLITNHTYLTGVIHRGLREQLLTAFDAIKVFDLHGSALLGLKSPNREADENVFDIQQGVSVASFVRRRVHGAANDLSYSDLWGSRDYKCQVLSGSLPLSQPISIVPKEPFFFFVNSPSTDETYETWISVKDLFEQSSVGFVTGKDEALISFEREPIASLVEDLANNSLSDDVIAARYKIKNTSGWAVARRRREVVHDTDRANHIIRVAYRPFDNRVTFYSDFLQRARYSVFRHLLKNNVALITSRLVKGERPAHFFVSRLPTEKIFISPKTSNNAFVFPLYCYTEERQIKGVATIRPNINKLHARRIAGMLGLVWQDDCENESDEGSALGPEDLFHYVYGVFFSSNYRTRYAEPLRIGFPRIPLTGKPTLFHNLARLGGELVSLHLMESPELNNNTVSFIGSDPPIVEKVSYSDETVWIDKAKTNGFKGVPENVWKLHIGGYQVCEKWLKDRRGRTLSEDDIVHYQKIIVALSETIRIMKEIDGVIDAHGGWPGAFQNNKSS